ncbi:MAG: LacI family DNA-binding transcriptional regulator [Anaerolineae bacterium]|nr:LacI family DNA-binding transcriptional regulator [Anaerolineae bacterium]
MPATSPKRPTIKDVARVAGVSFKTVSRVINEQPGVSEPVRARVRAAIADLGYVVNYSARSLASGGSGTLGVVIPRITDPHTLDLISHIGSVCERCHLDVIIVTRPAVADELSMSSFVGHGLAGALLFVAPRRMGRYLPFVRALHIPTVVIESMRVDEHGRLLPVTVPCVSSDHRQGAAEGVRYLWELGHRRVAFVSGSPSSQSHLRELGYRDAMAACGMQVAPEYVRSGDWSWESGRAQMEALLALDAPPTAVFCASDNIALGAMRAVQRAGLRVPEDVSILGFDDITAAQHSDPPLTTIRQPSLQMVEMAVDLLRCGLEGEQVAARNHLLPTNLVPRESCAACGQEADPG